MNSGTVTASENGEDIADFSSLCEAVLLTSDPVDASVNNFQSTDNSSEFYLRVVLILSRPT